MNKITVKSRKIIAICLATIILTDALYPKKLFALTDGPGSPEFSTFTPVGTNDLVDVFSGSFNYNLPVLNVPGPDGGGYGVSLSYNSGVTPEQEASWVGFGWSLNPGSIIRNTNGYPDDYDNVNIRYYNKTIPNNTITAKEDLGLEFFGYDNNKEEYNIRLFETSMGKTLRYNNYNGMSRIWGFTLGSKGVGIGMSYDGSNATFNAQLDPYRMLTPRKDNSRFESLDPEKFWENSQKKTIEKVQGGLFSAFNIHTHQSVTGPQILKPTEGLIANWSGSLEINYNIPVGFELGFSTTLSSVRTKDFFDRATDGYLYTFLNNTNEKDYIVEKSTPFSERSVNLAVPLSSSDQFIVTGEGLAGGFRAFLNEEMIAHPIYSNLQDIDIVNYGTEFALGTNIGAGVDIGVGKQKTESVEWQFHTPLSSRMPGNNSFFGFNNDEGGMIDYASSSQSSTTDVESAIIKRANDFIPFINVDYSPYYSKHQLLVDKVGHSSFIKYSTVGSVEKYNKSSSTSSLSYVPENASLIDQFQIVNNDGSTYVYGLPVYVRNEINIQVDVDVPGVYNQNTKTNHNNILNNYVVTKPVNESDLLDSEFEDDFLDDKNNRIVIGDKKTVPYAKNFLLTQITTPDYIDVANDGPDETDFGGWTKFDYKKKYQFGENSKGYHWRIPYSGLLYEKNEISNLLDDMGSLSMGDKEVFYLKTIETKTHIAFFVTNSSDQISDFTEYFTSGNIPPEHYLDGSLKVRYDGLEAEMNASDNLNDKGIKRTEMLERIVLYSKSDFSKPLQVTYFEYDNSLAKNLPNSDSQDPSATGKLTLKRVWSETDGVVKSKISPYVFKYEYFASYPQDINNKYEAIANYGKNLPESIQNPDYSPYEISTWGNHQYDGANRFNKMQNWLYQGTLPENTYDPAAWHLKCIKLPSGGEIHIQYEQNDYCFVQDRRAMSLVSLTGSDDSYDVPKYILNLADIGVNLSTIEKLEYINQLIKHFKGDPTTEADDEKIYFKFLYKLKGLSPNVNDIKSEYITGYAAVNNIYLGGANNESICVELKHKDPANNIYTPRKICYDFVLNRRGGKLDKPNNVTLYDSRALKTKDDIKSTFTDFANEYFFSFGGGPMYNWPPENVIGQDINESLSYLKIPMPDKVNEIMKSKRAGGARVKRILMYDSGIESGSAVLYGTEYKYELEDGSSSGVATNEPIGGKEENALVTFLPQERQGWLSKVISGPDKNQYEGPLGENLLPSASIGYSRVIIQNIHTGKTSTGFSIHEYYTVKDYPFDKDYSTDDISGSGVDQTSLGDKKLYNQKDRNHLNIGLYSSEVDKMWAAQGFRFIINDMHGKIRSLKHYSGEYSGNEIYSQLVSSQDYEYFEPGESISIWNGKELINSFPGKQVDITTEVSSIKDESTDINLEFDISLGLSWIIPVFITLVPRYQYKNVQLSNIATSKVIKYPAIIKKIRVYSEGTLAENENLVFDANTGKVLLTRYYDEYNNLNLAGNSSPHGGSVYNLTIPAAFIYNNLGQMSQEVGNSNQLNEVAGQFTTYGFSPFKTSNSINDMILENLVSAQVQTYKSNYYSDQSIIFNDYEIDIDDLAILNTKWKKEKSYIHKIKNLKSANSIYKVYEAGYFDTPVDMFDWSSPQNNWLKLSEITEYSPNGEVLEEKDVLDIYSSVKYGSKESKVRVQPSLIVHNGKYPQVAFRDFENEPIGPQISTEAHTGDQSYYLRYGQSFKLLTIPSNSVDNEFVNQGATIKFWAHCPNKSKPRINAWIGTKMIYFDKEAQSGDWSLFSAKLNSTFFTANEETVVWLTNQASECMLDDIVFHPTKAEVNSFVYDSKSLKLLAKFGSSHFGLLYGYNSEGKLVRTLVETEKGIKTIQESQYNNHTEKRI